MLKLNKFFEFISRNAYVKIIHQEQDLVLYDGPLKNIPDELDNCEVDDYKVTNEALFIFKVK